MHPILACTLMAAAAALLPAPALSQSNPATEADSAIIVTGDTEPPPRREVYEQALELSRIAPRRRFLYEQAMARFAAPLCPSVSGVSDRLADAIIARIRDNAGRLEVKLAKKRCTPNLIIGFVEDGREFFLDLERKHPKVFAKVDKAEREELLAEAGPVRVWNDVEPRWANGAPLPRWKGEIKVPTRSGYANKLLLPTRTDINQAVVLFDRNAVEGMELVQLADYATMRGLSHTRPAQGDEPMDTILALFADDSRLPTELTSFDIGYLRSLYWWRPDVPAVDKLLGVRKRAAKAREEETGP